MSWNPALGRAQTSRLKFSVDVKTHFSLSSRIFMYQAISSLNGISSFIHKKPVQVHAIFCQTLRGWRLQREREMVELKSQKKFFFTSFLLLDVLYYGLRYHKLYINEKLRLRQKISYYLYV